MERFMVLKKFDKQLVLSVLLMQCAMIECFFVFLADRKYLIVEVAVFLTAMALAAIKILEMKNAGSNSEIDGKWKKYVLLASALLIVELVLIGLIAVNKNAYFQNMYLPAVLKIICTLSTVTSVFAVVSSMTKTAKWFAVYIVGMVTLLVCNLTFSVVYSMSLSF